MTDAPASDEPFALRASPGFPEWLAGIGGSLALTTYQSGKLLFLGSEPDGQVSLFEREFPRAMGLAVAGDARGFALATQFQIHRFNDILTPEQSSRGFDAYYAPHTSWITGSVDLHDVGLDAQNRPVFVSTLYNCIASVSDSHNFKLLWKPPFVSELVAEDRCHLNGMAMADGRPRYATAVARSDVKDGWREQRANGGVVIDVETGEIVADGLSMPHSPRLHDGKLWLLNSGTGEFGFVDRTEGRFEPVAFCPGYARGLAFAGNCAIVGLSQPRDGGAFSGLPLDAALASRNSVPICGLVMIDLTRGEMIAWARIEGALKELYDVGFLPGVQRPSAIGFKTDEIKQIVSIDA
jgi:uncharacterized protein (TIGR03032 family)